MCVINLSRIIENPAFCAVIFPHVVNVLASFHKKRIKNKKKTGAEHNKLTKIKIAHTLRKKNLLTIIELMKKQKIKKNK